MTIRDAEQIIGTADVLDTDADDGEVRATLGNAALGVGYFKEAPFYTVDGFISRPNQPTANGDAAQALYLVDGDGRIVIGTRDNRFAENVGQLEEGDRAIVTDGEARVLIKKEGDKVILYTVNEPADKSMIVEMDGAGGTLKLMNGGSWIEISDDKIVIGAAGGLSMMTLDADGLQVDGGAFNCMTQGGVLGALTPPTPGTPGIPGFLFIAHSGPGAGSLVSERWKLSL